MVDKLDIGHSSAIVIEVVLLFVIFFVWFKPLTLTSEAVRLYFEKVLDVDGVLLGFAGLVLSVIIQRSKQSLSMKPTFALMMVAIFYLASIFLAFAEILDADAIASQILISALLYPLMFIMLGTDFLFYALIDMSRGSKTVGPANISRHRLTTTRRNH